MDFEFHFTKEHEDFRKEVRAFIDENALDESVVPWRRWIPDVEIFRKGREIERKMGAKGWRTPDFPKEYGGGGMDVESCIVLAEEVARITGENRWPANDYFPIEAGGVMLGGTEEQKQRFMPPLARNDWECWHCYTEPEAGTDEPNMKSTAVRDGDDYIINGTKIWVGDTPDPDRPDILWWAAVTDPKAPRQQNISMFIIPADAPGVQYFRINCYITQMGQKWQVTCEDVRVNKDRLIGEENKGWPLVSGSARNATGGAPMPEYPLIPRLIDYCKRKMHNGQPLIKNPKIKEVLIRLYVEYKADYLWALRDWAMLQDQIPRVGYLGSQQFLHQKQCLVYVARAISDVLGPYALVSDPEWDVIAKQVDYASKADALTHRGGTIEAMKIAVSRGLGLGRGAKK